MVRAPAFASERLQNPLKKQALSSFSVNWVYVRVRLAANGASPESAG